MSTMYCGDNCNHTGPHHYPPKPYGGQVINGPLLVELAAREAGRRQHRDWRRLSASHLIEVLNELGFKIVVEP